MGLVGKRPLPTFCSLPLNSRPLRAWGEPCGSVCLEEKAEVW